MSDEDEAYGSHRDIGRLKHEKSALEARIDELCAEVERLHADQAHWELGNCPNCPNVVSLQEALEQNAKLREQLEYDRQTSRSRLERIDQLKVENAKLRELVSGLEHCSQGFECNCCPLYDPSSTNHRRCESLERELGVVE